MIKLALLILAVPYLAHSQVLITDFCGTNSTADPTIIGECEAQSSSNVEPSRSGFGLKKRDGFSTAVNMAPTATSIKSAFIFKNQSGVEVVLASDQAGNVRRSANFASSTHLSTITAGARLYCKDNDGTAYCFTSSNDAPFSYDGTTYTEETLDGDGYINGKLNLFIQDRHLVAGATDFLNRLYISKSGDWDNFTGGLDEIDGWTEDIGRNGDRITGLLYLNGRVVVFKEFSIGAFSPIDTQFNSLFYNISDSIGISDPEAVAIHNGIAYLKASDNNFYAMDGNPGSIERISGKIKPDVADFLSGLNRQVILTTKADWDGGSTIIGGPGSPTNTVFIPGSVLASSITFVDVSSTNFAEGTISSGLSITDEIGKVKLPISEIITGNNDFELDNLSQWTCESGACAAVTLSMVVGSTYAAEVAASAQSAQNVFTYEVTGGGEEVLITGSLTDSACLTPTNVDATKVCYEHVDVSPYVATASSGAFRIRMINTNPGGVGKILSSTFPAISSFTFVWNERSSGSCATANQCFTFDNIISDLYFDPDDIASLETLTSRIFDTAFSTPIPGILRSTFTLSVADETNVAFYTRSSTSPNNDLWSSFVTSSDTLNLTAMTERYWQYKADFTTDIATKSAVLDDISLLAGTTAQYQTSCIEPGSGISSWGTLEVSGELAGVVGLGFEDRVGATCAGLGSYVATSSGATIGRATSAAYQVRVTFEMASATETARMDSLTVTWAEGAVPPAPSVAVWDDSVYLAVSSVTGSNNQVFRYIPSQGSIWPFALKTNQMIRYKDKLYMTSTTDGSLYQYSAQSRADAPTSDAGTNIIANWRSKLFSGGNPFVQSIFTEVSLLARDEDGGDVNVKWRLDGGDTATGNYDVGLSTGSGPVRYNFALPVGQRGQFFDLEFSDDSTEPFEILGIKLDGKQLPWRVIP